MKWIAPALRRWKYASRNTTKETLCLRGKVFVDEAKEKLVGLCKCDLLPVAGPIKTTMTLFAKWTRSGGSSQHGILHQVPYSPKFETHGDERFSVPTLRDTGVQVTFITVKLATALTIEIRRCRILEKLHGFERASCDSSPNVAKTVCETGGAICP